MDSIAGPCPIKGSANAHFQSMSSHIGHTILHVGDLHERGQGIRINNATPCHQANDICQLSTPGSGYQQPLIATGPSVELLRYQTVDVFASSISFDSSWASSS